MEGPAHVNHPASSVVFGKVLVDGRCQVCCGDRILHIVDGVSVPDERRGKGHQRHLVKVRRVYPFISNACGIPGCRRLHKNAEAHSLLRDGLHKSLPSFVSWTVQDARKIENHPQSEELFEVFWLGQVDEMLGLLKF